MIKMILQAVLHWQEKTEKLYCRTIDHRVKAEIQLNSSDRTDRPTVLLFFFLSLFVFFFFCVCKLWQKRERGTSSTLYCEFLLLLLLLCSRLEAPDIHGTRGQEFTAETAEGCCAATAAACNTTNKQTKKTNEQNIEHCAVQWQHRSGSSTVHSATAARGRGSLPDILYMFITRRILRKLISSYLGVIEFNLRSNSACELGTISSLFLRKAKLKTF